MVRNIWASKRHVAVNVNRSTEFMQTCLHFRSINVIRKENLKSCVWFWNWKTINLRHPDLYYTLTFVSMIKFMKAHSDYYPTFLTVAEEVSLKIVFVNLDAAVILYEGSARDHWPSNLCLLTTRYASLYIATRETASFYLAESYT